MRQNVPLIQAVYETQSVCSWTKTGNYGRNPLLYTWIGTHTGVAECAFHLDECPIARSVPFILRCAQKLKLRFFLVNLSAVGAEVKCDH